MCVDDSTINRKIEELKSHNLKNLFCILHKNAQNRNFFIYHPQSIAEKEKLNLLVDYGLIIITHSEFRIDNEGRVKASDFIGEITDLGNQLVTHL